MAIHFHQHRSVIEVITPTFSLRIICYTRNVRIFREWSHLSQWEWRG